MHHDSPFYNKYSKIKFYIEEYSGIQLIMGYVLVPFIQWLYILKDS